MASRQTIAWLVLSFLCTLYFQINICVSRTVPSTEDSRIEHQNNASSGVFLNTSNDIIIRVGKRLQLNCTITGAENSSKYHLSWYYGAHRLANNVTKKLNKQTLQLIFDHVDWNNNGTYFCKETGQNDVQPRHVTVRVGDIPSSPRNVWINNVGFRTIIHWTAPSHSGGLLLSYAVKGQCKNVTRPDVFFCGKTFSLCDSYGVKSGPELNTFMCIASASLLQDVATYIAIVEATNVLGSNRSIPVGFKFNQFRVLSTTPLPAKAFSAKEVNPAGTVKLSWENVRETIPLSLLVQYTILYYKDGDIKNKSLIVYSPSLYVMIHNLSASSLYHFYLLVQYGYENTTRFGTYSEAAMQTVMTSVLAPSRPPTITNCSQWWNVSGDPGLMVTWVFPPVEYFNGKLKHMNISYRCERGSRKITGNVSVRNVTAQSVAFPAIQPSDKCIVWMRICTGPKLCSGISNTCVKPASLKDKPTATSGNSKSSILKTVLFSLTGILVGLLLIVGICLCVRLRRRENRRRRLPPLSNALALPPVCHSYDEIEEPLVNNNYDIINVPMLD